MKSATYCRRSTPPSPSCASRLPPTADNEGRLLTELHTQAETCKFKLDAVQDLTCPMKLHVGPTNLADVVIGLAARIGPRFPQVQLHVEAPRRSH